MPCCIYLRKSRADAEAELRGAGETLARHENALTAFAKQAGLEVDKIYREIVSGETIGARPVMQRLLAEVSAGVWEGVIVMDVDRLARGNSIDQGIIAQTFLFARTKIITPTKTYDPTNEFDEEYFEFGLFMSRREYKMINRRLQRGRAASAKEGKYVGSRPPYGYDRVRLGNDKGFTLAPVAEQAEVVRNIYSWYTTGIIQPDGTRRRIGTSLISRELNDRHIRPPFGNAWTAPTIRDILTNPVYIGKIRWSWRPVKKKMDKGKVSAERSRNREPLIFDGMHEAIISGSAFDAAAAILAKNRPNPVRADKRILNPLAGLVVCRKCGRKMQRRPNKNAADLLMCPAPTCDDHASYLYLVENVVIDMLRNWTNGYLLPACADITDGSDDPKGELSSLLSAEAKLGSQLDRAYEAFETGIYDVKTFRKRSDRLKSSLEEINAKKEELIIRTRKADENRKLLREFIPRIKRIAETYSSVSDAANKHELLKNVIDHIDYIKESHGRGHEDDFIVTVYPRLPGR